MKRPKVPTYGHHKPTGQARVYVGGKSFYLGPFGSEASRIRYGEIVAKVVSGQPIDPFVPKASSPEAGLTVNELVLSFLKHATAYYTKNGRPMKWRASSRPSRRWWRCSDSLRWTSSARSRSSRCEITTS